MTNTLVNDNKAVVYAKLWDDWRLRTEKDKREKTGARHRENSRIYSMIYIEIIFHLSIIWTIWIIYYYW